MKPKVIRDYLRLFCSYLFLILYVPHILVLFCRKNLKEYAYSDANVMAKRLDIKIHNWNAFIYFLHNNAFFRKLFYHRCGQIVKLIIGWWRPGDKYFTINAVTKIGKNCELLHPVCSRINAVSIGDNFCILHGTSIGRKSGKIPTIGNNVTLGMNVLILGGITVGDNVIVGAGSVVVKDVPSNCVVAGNPAKVIKELPPLKNDRLVFGRL